MLLKFAPKFTEADLGELHLLLLYIKNESIRYDFLYNMIDIKFAGS